MWCYCGQALEKLLLAEGSKMVMVAFQSSYSQGVYGLVSNLGSLVVRTIFQVSHPCVPHNSHPFVPHSCLCVVPTLLFPLRLIDVCIASLEYVRQSSASPVLHAG